MPRNTEAGGGYGAGSEHRSFSAGGGGAEGAPPARQRVQSPNTPEAWRTNPVTPRRVSSPRSAGTPGAEGSPTRIKDIVRKGAEVVKRRLSGEDTGTATPSAGGAPEAQQRPDPTPISAAPAEDRARIKAETLAERIPASGTKVPTLSERAQESLRKLRNYSRPDATPPVPPQPGPDAAPQQPDPVPADETPTGPIPVVPPEGTAAPDPAPQPSHEQGSGETGQPDAGQGAPDANPEPDDTPTEPIPIIPREPVNPQAAEAELGEREDEALLTMFDHLMHRASLGDQEALIAAGRIFSVAELRGGTLLGRIEQLSRTKTEPDTISEPDDTVLFHVESVLHDYETMPLAEKHSHLQFYGSDYDDGQNGELRAYVQERRRLWRLRQQQPQS